MGEYSETPTTTNYDSFSQQEAVFFPSIEMDIV
jgi:hypothetical protein